MPSHTRQVSSPSDRSRPPLIHRHSIGPLAIGAHHESKGCSLHRSIERTYQTHAPLHTHTIFGILSGDHHHSNGVGGRQEIDHSYA